MLKIKMKKYITIMIYLTNVVFTSYIYLFFINISQKFLIYFNKYLNLLLDRKIIQITHVNHLYVRIIN